MIIDSTTSFAEVHLDKIQKLQAAIDRKKSRKLRDDMRRNEHLFITRVNGHLFITRVNGYVRDILSMGDSFTPVQKKHIAAVFLSDRMSDAVELFKATVGRTCRLGLRNRS